MKQGIVITDKSLYLWKDLNLDIESILKKLAILNNDLYFFSPDFIGRSKVDTKDFLKYVLRNCIGHKTNLSFVDQIFNTNSNFTNAIWSDFELHSGKIYEFMGFIKNFEEIIVHKHPTMERYKKNTLVNFVYGINHLNYIHEIARVETALGIYCSNFLPEITFNSTPFHLDYQNEILKKQKMDELNTFTQILEGLFFDFGQLKWKNIIELRKSGFAESFRHEFRSWISSSDDKISFNQNLKNINKYIFDSSFKFIEENRSNPRKQIIKTVKFNFPLFVLPLNPYSLLHDTIQIKKQIDSEKKYAWLLFLEELKHQKL